MWAIARSVHVSIFFTAGLVRRPRASLKLYNFHSYFPIELSSMKCPYVADRKRCVPVILFFKLNKSFLLYFRPNFILGVVIIKMLFVIKNNSNLG